jgi:peptidoglycan/LPS O-acetylase OafA/YrhL
MTRESSPYRPELDSLRAVAIIIVLLHHYIRERHFVLGGFGAMLFFVLSSYFGTRSLLQLKADVDTGALGPTAALKLFYGRRYFRIVPVHLIVLAIAALANVPYARDAFWWNAPFLANVGMLWRDEWFGPFSPLWSLAVLEQFYFWWPLAVLLLTRRRLQLAMVLLIVSASAWRIICHHYYLGPFYWTVVPLSTFDQLGFGSLLALVRAEPAYAGWLRGLRSVVAWPSGLVLASLVIGRLNGMVSAPYEVFWISVVGCLFLVWLIDRSLSGIGGPAGAVLRNRILAEAGRLSYSVFLIHSFTELFLPRAGWLGALLETDWRALVLIPLTFALAQAMWTYVEVPLARFRKRRFQIRNVPVPGADSLARAA